MCFDDLNFPPYNLIHDTQLTSADRRPLAAALAALARELAGAVVEKFRKNRRPRRTVHLFGLTWPTCLSACLDSAENVFLTNQSRDSGIIVRESAETVKIQIIHLWNRRRKQKCSIEK